MMTRGNYPAPVPVPIEADSMRAITTAASASARIKSIRVTLFIVFLCHVKRSLAVRVRPFAEINPLHPHSRHL